MTTILQQRRRFWQWRDCTPT